MNEQYLWDKIRDWYYQHGFFAVAEDMRTIIQYREPKDLWKDLVNR